MSTRTHASQLPSNEEIKEMMAKEAQRQPVTDSSFVDFSVVNEWMSKLKIDTKLFELASIEEVNIEVDLVKPLVVQKTLELKDGSIFKPIEEYLGEEDKLEKADLAIAFGGKKLARAEKAAELYLGGWVSRLLMTGKSPNYTNFFNVSEAEAFKKRAMELGVPEEAIITETEAINIPSNVTGSLNLLDKLEINYSSIIQLISWYAQRRAWCCMKKFLDPSVKLIRVNVPWHKEDGSLGEYELGEWQKTGEGIQIVFNEFVKMKHQSLTQRA